MADYFDSCSSIDPFLRCVAEDSSAAGNNNGIHENGGPMASSSGILDSIRNLKRNTTTTTTSTKSNKHNVAATRNMTSNERKEMLKERLENFLSNGWLNQEEYRKYVAFLSTFDKSDCVGESGKYALKELEKELDATEKEEEEKMMKRTRSKQQQQQSITSSWREMLTPSFLTSSNNNHTSSSSLSSSSSSSSSVSSTTKNLTVNTNTATSGNKKQQQQQQTQQQQQPQPLATATHRVNNGGGAIHAPTIVSPQDISNCVTETEISELFVETCFFARLGFVQPPCCLSCTYQEAMHSKTPLLHCQRWVIWRKDATQIFDPTHAKMRDNAIVVRCQSARKLISGRMIEGYQWDTQEKKLVQRL
mmetsp:Transcript_795/g.850  ORF Transcript_795/g.850 Transcript_795/m.850 type:complete len:362 (-) Transcript_795:71-1156(-)